MALWFEKTFELNILVVKNNLLANEFIILDGDHVSKICKYYWKEEKPEKKSPRVSIKFDKFQNVGEIVKSFNLNCGIKFFTNPGIFQDSEKSSSYLLLKGVVSELSWFNMLNQFKLLNHSTNKLPLLKFEEVGNDFFTFNFRPVKTLFDLNSVSIEKIKKKISEEKYLNEGDILSFENKNKPFRPLNELQQMRHETFVIISPEKSLSPVSSFIPPPISSNSHLDILHCFDHVTEDLKNLIKPFLFIKNFKISPSILLDAAQNSGLPSLLKSLSIHFHIHFYSLDCLSLNYQSPASVESSIVHAFQKAVELKPCFLLLENLDALVLIEENRLGLMFENCFQVFMQTLPFASMPTILMATTSSPEALPYQLQKHFLYNYLFESPDEEMRRKMLIKIISKYEEIKEEKKLKKNEFKEKKENKEENELIDSLIKLTGGFQFHTLQLVCDMTHQTSRLKNKKLRLEDFEESLKRLHQLNPQAPSSVNVPKVSWEDVGGLDHVIKELKDMMEMPKKYPMLKKVGLQRTGILLFGPPGTGKTLLAKAVATQSSLNFMSVKGPELLNMYVGQSEENVRQVFQRASNNKPCVVFFDELDSLAPKRGKSADSGGVIDRVVSQLLAELDGMDQREGVHVIGATNRPDLLDPALLRPGRFDKVVYVGVDDNKQNRIKILKALTNKYCLDSDVNLEEVADSIKGKMTGADLSGLCSMAVMSCLRRKIKQIEEKNNLKQEEIPRDDYEVILNQSDFIEATSQCKPSLTEEEMKKYEEFKNKMKN